MWGNKIGTASAVVDGINAYEECAFEAGNMSPLVTQPETFEIGSIVKLG